MVRSRSQLASSYAPGALFTFEGGMGACLSIPDQHVRVMPDTSKVLPKFLENMMNSLIFQEEAKGKASKSVNQANINATMMRNINVPVPSIPEQKKFVAKIDALEKQIADAQAVIDGATARKQSILQKHL